MPITMLNETQGLELLEALEHAQEIVRNTKKDASIISIGSNSWVAIQTEPYEYYDQTLVRICYTNADFLGYSNPITGKKIKYTTIK